MKRKYDSSSSDCEDDQPLSYYNGYRVITKNELLRHTIERCDFCEAVFYNKYSMMVHNATHIIIPLLRKKFYSCPKCNSHFNSKESLDEHNLTKHLNITNKEDFPEIIESIMTKEPYAVLTKEEFEINKKDVSKSDILESFVLKQPVTLITKENFEIEKETNSNLLESFVNKKAITLVNPLLINEEVINISDDESNSTDNNDYFEKSIDKKENNIKNRLLFEDDEEDEDIINTNGDDLNVGDKAMPGHVVNSDLRDNLKSNMIILGKYPCDAQYKSVHYDELVKPGLFMCRKCNEAFPNRYDLAIHDTTHMRFKRRAPILCRICDWYVTNNHWALRAHQSRCHPTKTDPSIELTRCRKCKLSYVYLYRHMRNYHNVFMCRVGDCNLTFDNYEDYEQHKFVHRKYTVLLSNKSDDDGKDKSMFSSPMEFWYTKTVKVCDLCYLFFKNKSNMQYEHLGNETEMGVRHPCERCGKKLFELNLVKFKAKKKIFYGPHGKKKVTNEDRLKTVQNRLKKLKLLNKF